MVEKEVVCESTNNELKSIIHLFIYLFIYLSTILMSFRFSAQTWVASFRNNFKMIPNPILSIIMVAFLEENKAFLSVVFREVAFDIPIRPSYYF